MKIWIVSMECAGIVEAGGVKNVTFSLAKELYEMGHDVTLFIPYFKCTNKSNIFLDSFGRIEGMCSINGAVEVLGYYSGFYGNEFDDKDNFKVVLVDHPSFSEKEAVYTYTENEQKKNPQFIKGTGHKDGLFMDILFQKAVCAYPEFVDEKNSPDIILCQDASTAVLPAFIKNNQDLKTTNNFKNTQTVVTIHNAGPFYHHQFRDINEAQKYTGLSYEILRQAMNKDCVEPFLLASISGAYLTTVSEEYAKELVDPKNVEMTDGLSKIFADRNISIKGIVNGFDYERYDPTDVKISKLPFAFSPNKAFIDGKFSCRDYFLNEFAKEEQDPQLMEGIKRYGSVINKSNTGKFGKIYICYHGRIATQKGISVLTKAIPPIIDNFSNVNFIIAGQGETKLEEEIISLTQQYPDRIIFLNGYNQKLVRLAVAASDFIVLPSYFEPCGLEDFIAQAYATIPIAHKTGGLNKIQDYKTGFLYNNNTPGALIAKLSEVIMLYMYKTSLIPRMREIAFNTICKEFNWKNIISKKYLPFFKEILKKR